ncbi:FadR/GntR family transcriptional regulator [Kribbella sp. NPDC049174]|uniref:FadR/GntR family transcriptional regulator n=1 Tax=Kribbella sp. NPDC049174 TaxID=3364112 RepID=UPI00371B7967
MSSPAGGSQTDVVVQGIKQMIVDGTLKAGDKLPIEKVLGESLGVSRGPLREAVRALSIMGVLETRQGDGTYVTALDPSLLLAPMGFVVDLQNRSGAHHLHAVRRMLETEAAAQAASRITSEALQAAEAALDRAEAELTRAGGPDHEAIIDSDIAFHRLIAEASGNPVLEALIEALSGRTVRGRLWRSISQTGADEATHAEHRAILAALADHDADRARARMAAHLFAVEDYLRDRPPAL